MEGMLSTKNFREFYMTLAVEPETIADYFEVMKKATSQIAEDIHLGHCLLIVNSPATSMELSGLQDRSQIYKDPNGYDEINGVRQTFVTGDWGIVQLEISPKVGWVWTDEEAEEIEFLIQVVFDCISKARNAILMRRASITDPLTGACNMTGLINYSTELKRKGELEGFDAIYFSIKNYNYINLRVGAREGEKVLKSFSGMVRDFLINGELFGRIGGDTFMILMNKDRTEEGIKYLTSRRILVNLEQRSVEFDLMVRIGAYKIHSVDDSNRVIEAARTAWGYTNNPSAGDVVWFSEDMLKQSKHDQEVSNRFSKALKNNEFVVYYQPKVDINTSKLVAAEALCRWVKDDEIVPPMEFIPVLEREGSISDLDFYMLNRVCEHLKEWIERGIEPVRVSVNFSRANILNRKLAEKIVKVIGSHKVDCKYLEIEITEMSGYEDFESLSEFVNIMKKNGVETSIDDFGTGYSSLNLIRELNVDTIKLDKSFLEKINGEENQDKTMVKSIISMVNELNMKVVAEGVENVSQMNFLKEVSCQVAQGFLFDKPLPKEKFEFRLIGERMY